MNGWTPAVVVRNPAVLCRPTVARAGKRIEIQVWSANGWPAQTAVFTPTIARAFASALSEAADKLEGRAHG